MEEEKLQLLKRMVRRVEDQPRFMAHVPACLCHYIHLKGMDQGTLMARLGVDQVAFIRLALCWRPRALCFDSDLVRIAEVVGVDPAQLAQVIHEVDDAEKLIEPYCRSGTGEIDAGLSSTRSRKQ